MVDGLEAAADITRINALCFLCHNKVVNNFKQPYNNYNKKNEIDIYLKKKSHSCDTQRCFNFCQWLEIANSLQIYENVCYATSTIL